MPSPAEPLLQTCKAASDSLRVAILRVLRSESYAVQELCRIFETNQPNMSHHLKILASAGLVTTRKQGNSVFYRRHGFADRDSGSGLLQELFAAIDRIPVSPETEDRCDLIHRERTEQSRDFFNRNAARLKQNQDLIAELPHYLSCITELLDNESFNESGHVVEVGPGDSELIDHLAARFKSVTGVDNNPEMLSRAQARLGGHQNPTVRLAELGDLAHRSADLVVLNMVLHHTPSPSHIFRAAGHVLRDNGGLLIADLCHHDQDWVRDVCGDLWLGFNSEELAAWGKAAGFAPPCSTYLAMRNGFQVQAHLFRQIRETQNTH